MGRETECPVCNAYIPLDPDVTEGEYIYCSFCGAQLRVGNIIENEEEGKKVKVEEDWDD